MRREAKALILALTGVALAAGTAAAQQQSTFRWSGELAAGKALAVHNVNGDLHVRPAGAGSVEVTAVKHARKSDPASVDVAVRPTSDGLEVCVIYPAKDGGTIDSCRRGQHGEMARNDVTVELTVAIPRGVTLDGNTVNGDVEVERLDGNVAVRTVNGGIHVASSGTVQAETVNGSIVAAMESASWSGALDFETVNGSISLTLPAGVRAGVSAETVNGDFSSDFPLSVEAGRWGPKRIHGTIGDGGGSLSLKTVNGGIELRKS